MALTPQQLATLKADILADPALNAFPNNADGNTAIANAYNQNASPAFTVWKTNVSITAIGDKFNGAELGGLTSANQTRLQTIAQYSPMGVNPSLADRRQFFDDIFSGAGGAVTRPARIPHRSRGSPRSRQRSRPRSGCSSGRRNRTLRGAAARARRG